MLRKLVLGLLCVASLGGWTSSAFADDKPVNHLREVLRPLAKEILDVVVDDQGQSGIIVGDFSGDGRSNFGPGISEVLKSLLQELKPGLVKEDAPLTLKGEYQRINDDKNPSLIVVRTLVTIRDENGKRIDEKSLDIRDTGLIADILGVTVSLPPLATREKRNEELKQADKKPSFKQEGTVIRIASGKPYGVEFLVTSKDKAPKTAAQWENIPARAPHSENGKAFLDIARDEVYALRIYNDTPHDAAVAISIDGLSVFSFSEIRDVKSGQPKYTRYIVPPGGGIIPGWHKTNEHADSFLVTEYGKAAAAGQPTITRGKTGVVTVKFAIAWSGDDIPDAERGGRDGGNATGFGPPVKVNQTEVERHIGVERDVISVRYTR